MVDKDIFGEVDKSKLRLQKPKSGRPPVVGSPSPEQIRKLRKLKPQTSEGAAASPSLFEGDLAPGTKVEHSRFGRGEILRIEGVGGDKKAEIKFQVGGIKKLLLRFAKLKVLS